VIEVTGGHAATAYHRIVKISSFAGLMDSLECSRAGGAPRRPAGAQPEETDPLKPKVPRPSGSSRELPESAGSGEFEWEAPVVEVSRLAAQAAPAAPGPEPEPPAAAGEMDPEGPGNPRIRERYYAIRFPGAPGIAPGADVPSLVKMARLYFEDGDGGRAVELLDCAAAALPREENLRLAGLQILFLMRKGEAFVQAARAFRARFPNSPRWAEIERLGWRFAPRERLFAGGRPDGVANDEHFGAWPECPNWIEAPYDLTNDVLGVELRGWVLGTATSP
jgi:hypothetical protein